MLTTPCLLFFHFKNVNLFERLPVKKKRVRYTETSSGLFPSGCKNQRRAGLKPKARSFFQVFQVSAAAEALELSSAAFLGYWQEVEAELHQLSQIGCQHHSWGFACYAMYFLALITTFFIKSSFLTQLPFGTSGYNVLPIQNFFTQCE